MNVEIESLEHEVTRVQTSGEVSRSRYTETYYNWHIHIMSGHDTRIVTYIHTDMAIVVYESGRVGKCLYTLTNTYAWIRQVEMQKEEDHRHMSKAMCTSIGYVYINRHRDIVVHWICRKKKRGKKWL